MVKLLPREGKPLPEALVVSSTTSPLSVDGFSVEGVGAEDVDSSVVSTESARALQIVVRTRKQITNCNIPKKYWKHDFVYYVIADVRP